jgi:V8-like Glu-specific endopeptidase
MRVLQFVTVSVTMLAGLLNSCGRPQSSSSPLDDIYNNDDQMRHNATKEELRWTVRMSGCTASMLTPTRLLTAHHCMPFPDQIYTSGAALGMGGRSDLKVLTIPERSSTLDYAIVEVKWLKSANIAEQRYTPKIMTSISSLSMGLDSAVGTTKLLTVGFPADKKTAQAARGFAKKSTDQSLYYNVGTINGNSGGAVWRESDMMLVSNTNFGTHSYQQSGWNHNDPENEKVWNGGTRMDVIYAQSPELKKIFVNGVNQFTTETGELKN